MKNVFIQSRILFYMWNLANIKQILIFLEKRKVTLIKIRSCISCYFSKAAFFDPKLSQVKPEMWMPQIENSSSSSQPAQSTGLTTQPYDVNCHSELQTIFKLRQIKILRPLCSFNLWAFI